VKAPDRPVHRGRRVAASGLLVSAGFFLLLGAIAWLSGEGRPLGDADGSIARWIPPERASVHAFFSAVTRLGDWPVVLAAAGCAGILLWRRDRCGRPLARCGRAVAAVVSAAGAGLLDEAIKRLFLRPRPPAPFPSPSGYAFPSGHATMAVAFYGLCAWLVLRSRLSRPWKVAAVAGSVLLVLVVGASRVYLSAHWLSDVLGGYATGAAWLTLCITALRLTAIKRR
jgi:membrane-associated phospholipid phosphatase